MPEDWGEPQFDDPSKVNYFSTESSTGSKLKLQFSHRAGPAPWGHLLTIRNEGKDLVKGEKIKLFCGGKKKSRKRRTKYKGRRPRRQKSRRRPRRQKFRRLRKSRKVRGRNTRNTKKKMSLPPSMKQLRDWLGPTEFGKLKVR